jgi:hypothetical protein
MQHWNHILNRQRGKRMSWNWMMGNFSECRFRSREGSVRWRQACRRVGASDSDPSFPEKGDAVVSSPHPKHPHMPTVSPSSPLPIQPNCCPGPHNKEKRLICVSLFPSSNCPRISNWVTFVVADKIGESLPPLLLSPSLPVLGMRGFSGGCGGQHSHIRMRVQGCSGSNGSTMQYQAVCGGHFP